MILRQIAFTSANFGDDKRDDFYIRLHREMARTSFVERVNIPRISFHIESPSDRREVRSTLRLSQ